MFIGKSWEAIAIEAFENGADFYLQNILCGYSRNGDFVSPAIWKCMLECV
jgi:hypothetical protein